MLARICPHSLRYQSPGRHIRQTSLNIVPTGRNARERSGPIDEDVRRCRVQALVVERNTACILDRVPQLEVGSRVGAYDQRVARVERLVDDVRVENESR